MISLRNLNRDNWVECIGLKLHEDQIGNLASNVHTLAESKFNPHYRLRAIYRDEQMAGLLAYTPEDDPPDESLYWIYRLMITADLQRQGIGISAMKLAIAEITELGASRIRTMHKPSNTAAASLYKRLGFKNIGLHDDGDILLEIAL